MRPFLLVGCGGSGGATLQFLIDQLTADLAMRKIHGLPDAWQFVHVDVPAAGDGVGADMPPVVATHRNGTYIGLASAAVSYSAMANSLSQQLITAGQYGQLATWYGNPNKVNVPISQGAGQQRAVGRVVTLSRLRLVRDGLEAALTKLKTPGAPEELQALTERVSPGTESLVRMSPVVIVVSSMAGGAGASMVLDVCRVLSEQGAIEANATALFLYTPEVFQKLAAEDRAGIPGNALAMTGELIATQLGAASDDDRALVEAAGLGQGRAGRSIPFGRVFPIGGKIGNTGTTFGDGSAKQIYRGLGRGLAALMLSGEATQRWTGFDLTNPTAVPVDSTAFGWSAEPNDLQWGSFGFAQLNMGRDRYAEYAAQRLARSAVLRLVAGHRQAGDAGTDQEQRDRMVNERMPSFESRLGLPTDATSVEAWLLGGFRDAAWASAGSLVQKHVERHLEVGAGTPAQQWLSYVQTVIGQNSASLNAASSADAYRHAYGWYSRVLPTVEHEVEIAVSTYGIPVTAEMLRRLDNSIGHAVGSLSAQADHWRYDAVAIDQATVGRAAAVKGAIDGRSAIIQIIREGYQNSLYLAILGALAAKLTEIVGAMRAELIDPLRQACADTQRTLEVAVAPQRNRGSVVQLQTELFNEWPAEDQQVPARFTHAQNEVLLIDAALFSGQFGTHVVRTMNLPDRPVTSPSDALAMAAREIVLWDWPTTGGQQTGRLLEQRARWRPASLSTEPGSSEPVGTRRGSYRIAADPGEILDRARTWVERPRQPFDEFVGTSLHDYVGSSDLSSSVRAERSQEVARKFRETLELAQPLVALSTKLVADLHGSYEARVAYKFSEVPLAGLEVADELLRGLTGSSAHVTSGTNFEQALRATSSATRIDIFGSYAPLAPLAFTSLLKPLAAGWGESVVPGARTTFWTARRSRRLNGALAMNERQRRALVAGWYAARYTGRLRLPEEAPGAQSAQVWDEEFERWVSFPSPLIVPPSELARTVNNYLPAVLLSYTLAAAQVTATEDLGPLRPYTVLRCYWDDSPSGVDLSIDDNPDLLSVTSHFRSFFRSQSFPQGAPAAFTHPFTGDAEVDRKMLIQKLGKVHDTVGKDYLPPSDSGLTGGGKYSIIRRADDMWAVPLFHEVAADVYWATGLLGGILDRAFAADDDELV